MRIRKKGIILLLCLFTSLAAAGLVFLGPQNTNGASDDAEFKRQVRNALAELSLPANNDPSAIDTGKTNIAEFLNYRSGVLVSDAQQERLGTAERQALEGGKRISRSDLADILTDLAVAKLTTITDEQKAAAVEALRGFDAPDLPESFKRGRGKVSVRANGTGTMTVEAFRARLDSISGENAEGKIVRSMIRSSAALEIEQVCALLAEADPDFFNGTKCDMTALQAVLVAYAVVTDDDLAGNRADLSSRMESIRTGIERKFNVDYPAPTGHKAYGRNGYIYSSPADLALDSHSIDLLIQKITQKLDR